MNDRLPITLTDLRREASRFSTEESAHREPSLFGVTDGKAVGTYLEHKFQATLLERFIFERGNSANGIDFPEIDVDLKVTSVRQPQSSSPFRSARQKVFGLGYNLLVFVYEKTDDPVDRTATLRIVHTIFVEKERTGDFQTTTGIRRLLENDANEDDLVGFMAERNLPLDDIEARRIAAELLIQPPEVGYLTISNALQWRLQYTRAIANAGDVDGIYRL